METYGIEKLGIVNPKAVYRNLTPAQLTEAALRRGEGKLSNTGALVVTTGNIQDVLLKINSSLILLLFMMTLHGEALTFLSLRRSSMQFVLK